MLCWAQDRRDDRHRCGLGAGHGRPWLLCLPLMGELQSLRSLSLVSSGKNSKNLYLFP